MTEKIEIRVPDIGDFKDVEVIEVLVSAGDKVNKEDPLITLESDKATMDIPAPVAGTVTEIKIKSGDKVSEGSLILNLDTDDVTTVKTGPGKKTEGKSKSRSAATTGAADKSSSDKHFEVAVLGAGPGGYTAAFRAADLGKKTLLIERYPVLGGVCLNVGCIPSKALLHIARVITEIGELREHGIDLGNNSADKKQIRAWTESVVSRLTGGLRQMAKQRNIEVIQGTGKFISTHNMEVINGSSKTIISFDHAIIAAGSQSATIPGLPEDPRILDSTSALLLEKVPERMLVIGGGIIGLEMATVYDALGTGITIVEMLDALIVGCDKDIVRPLQKRITKRYENIFLKTSVSGVSTTKQKLQVTFS